VDRDSGAPGFLSLSPVIVVVAVVVSVVVAFQVDAVEDHSQDSGVSEFELSFGFQDGFSVGDIGSGNEDDPIDQAGRNGGMSGSQNGG
jgi:hypothetical protein